MKRSWSKRKKLYAGAVVISALLLLAAILNYHSFNDAKAACIENNKTPVVDKTFLALNWSVSCQSLVISGQQLAE